MLNLSSVYKTVSGHQNDQTADSFSVDSLTYNQAPKFKFILLKLEIVTAVLQ